jgi:hypothetical protein
MSVAKVWAYGRRQVATACVGDLSQAVDVVGGCLEAVTIALAISDSARARVVLPCRTWTRKL